MVEPQQVSFLKRKKGVKGVKSVSPFHLFICTAN